MSDWEVIGPLPSDRSEPPDDDPVDGFYSEQFAGDSGSASSLSESSVFPAGPSSLNPRRDRLDGDDSLSRSSRHRRHSRSRDSASQRSLDQAAHDLLRSAFDAQKYAQFHDAATRQRAEHGIGNSQAMIALYHFWCYFLRDRFDAEMYQEFLGTAREDAAAGSHYGIECYFRFCSYGLETRWDPQVFGQFQFEALADYARGSTYGLEKVKSFIVHQKFEFPIELNEEMNAALKRFPTLESFRTAAAERQPAHPGARGGRARGRGGQARARGRAQQREERGGWTFGRPQPQASSVPADSPIRRSFGRPR